MDNSLISLLSSTSLSSSNSTTGDHSHIDLYGYTPSLGLSIAAVIGFSVVTLCLTVLSIKYKKYYFLVACVAGLVETAGYALRIVSANKPDEIGIYVATTLFILIPPSALAAVILFGQLGRIMQKTGIKHRIFRPNVVKYLFLGVDIFSILLQASGGGLLAQSSSNPSMGNIGKNVMLASLAIALSSFTFFFFLIIFLHFKVRRIEEDDKSWRKIFIGLYVSGFLIVLRSVYRVAEYSGGYQSAIMLNEPLFYGLDTLPIFLFMAVWVSPLHPGFINLTTKDEEDKKLSPATYA